MNYEKQLEAKDETIFRLIRIIEKLLQAQSVQKIIE